MNIYIYHEVFYRIYIEHSTHDAKRKETRCGANEVFIIGAKRRGDWGRGGMG